MPTKNTYSEEGVRAKGRSKTDKARRSFELHGQYSSKHLRIREVTCVPAAERQRNPRKDGPKKKK